MPINTKPLSDLTEEDLQTLIQDQVREGKEIEYKEALPGKSDAERKEFLADVASFANAGGGHILSGVKERRDPKNEQTGEPEALVGIDSVNASSAIQRLEHMIQDGIAPRIQGIQFQPVSLAIGGMVLVVRVPRSWSGPHMVTYQDSCKFYSRNSSGKYILDVGQIRSAFLGSEFIPDRARRFRTERLASIVAGETPVPLRDVPYCVLHVVPLTAFDPAIRLDLGPMTDAPLFDLSGSCHRVRPNLDGLLTFGPIEEQGRTDTYAQLYRSGAVEAVAGNFTGLWEGRRLIRSVMCEENVIMALRQYLQTLDRLGSSPPGLVMLSWTGVKGYSMSVDDFRYVTGRAEDHAIDRDVLAVPEVVVENWQENAASLLKPCFDAVWNASGYRESLNYNKEGQWVGMR